MSSPYGTTAKYSTTTEVDLKLKKMLPICGQLKSGFDYKIFRVTRDKKTTHTLDGSANAAHPESIFLSNKPLLTAHLSKLLDDVIEAGDTYPQLDKIGIDGFFDYFLSHDAFILLKSSGEADAAVNQESFDGSALWNDHVMGMFYIKPNFPGRAAHICNGGFITAPRFRSMGAGKQMGAAFVKLAPTLGYKASLFNLVYATNAPSIKLWRDLGFRETGRIPKAGKLNNHDEYVDAINFYYDFDA